LFVSFSCHAPAPPVCLAEASGEGGSERILNQMVLKGFTIVGLMSQGEKAHNLRPATNDSERKSEQLLAGLNSKIPEA
jgi:hypothetical protein